MKLSYRFLSCFLLISFVGCTRQEVAPVETSFRVWWGSWALQQTGYLTPDSVITGPASPAGAAQSLTFTPQNRLSTEGSELAYFANWPFYQVDSTQTGLLLRLSGGPASTPVTTARILIQNDRMTIYPSSCSTGCFYRLVRLYNID